MKLVVSGATGDVGRRVVADRPRQYDLLQRVAYDAAYAFTMRQSRRKEQQTGRQYTKIWRAFDA